MTKLTLASSVFAVGLVTACAGKPAATTPGPTPAAVPVIALAELKFYDNDQLGMQLHANGQIEARFKSFENGKTTEGWKTIGTLAADGSIKGDSGTMHLATDGTLHKPDGSVEPTFKLDGDTLVIADKHVTLDAKGVFLVDGKPTPNGTMRVEGAGDPGTRHTALVMVGLMFGGTAETHVMKGPDAKVETAVPPMQ